MSATSLPAQTLQPALFEALLPMNHHWPVDADLRRHRPLAETLSTQ